MNFSLPLKSFEVDRISYDVKKLFHRGSMMFIPKHLLLLRLTDALKYDAKLVLRLQIMLVEFQHPTRNLSRNNKNLLLLLLLYIQGPRLP